MQTERDAKIVDWICRIGAAGIDHVARWFGMSPQTVKVRLASLAKDGLLERHLVLWDLAAPRVAPTVERAAQKANALDRITVLALEDTAGLVERELAIERTVAPAARELAREEATDVRL